MEASSTSIIGRCYPTRVSNFFAQTIVLNETQEALLQLTPFHCYTRIPQIRLDSSLLDYLIRQWDRKTNAFDIKGKKIPFTVEDVSLITGLKCYGDVVNFQNKEGKNDLQIQIFDGKPITRNLLESKLVDLRGIEDEATTRLFVRLVILYLFSTLFFAQKNYSVPESLVKYTENLEHLGDYNWSRAIHSFLVKHIDSAHKKIEQPNNWTEITIGGFSIILNVWFFEHAKCHYDTLNEVDLNSPRLFHWVKASFKQKATHIRVVENLKSIEMIEVLHPTTHEAHLIKQANPQENSLQEQNCRIEKVEVELVEMRAKMTCLEKTIGDLIVENQRLHRLLRSHGIEDNTTIEVVKKRKKDSKEIIDVSDLPTKGNTGDQASIVGGAINFVKELEKLVQSLEVHKRIKQRSTSAPFADFFTFPQYFTSSSRCATNDTTTDEAAVEKQSSLADIEVTMVESHANLKVLAQRRPKQLLKLVVGLQNLHLIILHLNITTVDEMVLYSFSLKVEDQCRMTSADDIATSVHQIVGK